MERLLWFAVSLTGLLSKNSSVDGNQDHGMFIIEPRVETPTQEVPVPSEAEIEEASTLLKGKTSTARDYVPSPEDIEEALNYGFNVSSKLLKGQTSTARGEGIVFDSSSILQLGFHEPSEDSMNQACVGLGFVEATKFLQEKHFPGMNNNTLAAAIFNGMEVDKQLCYKVVEKACGVRHINYSEIVCHPEKPYRTYDGSCNNLNNPLWGSSSSPFTRFLEPAYEDGVNSLRGSGNLSLPSARKVSVELQNTKERPVLEDFTMMIMQWGQFLSHDLSLAPEVAVKINGTSKPLECCMNGVQRMSDNIDECQPIDTSNDTFYSKHDKACMRFVRSLTANKGCHFGAREQLNQQTSFVDASMVYGSKEAMALELRTKKDGMLNGTWMRGKTKFDFLTKKTKCKKMFKTCFASGDGRVDEAAGLTSIHTVFHRLHNIIVSNLQELNPDWEDEILYQEGRRIVVALMQQITYKEYLPLILGPEIMEYFHLTVQDDGYMYKYHNGCNPSVANAFSTAAFRFGHSMIKENFINGLEKIPLQGNFFNISNFLSGRTCPSSIIEGLTDDPLAGNDVVLTPVVSQHLFAPFGKTVGLDLMALNIQRGRDHGLPGYLEWRSACKLSSIPTNFDELSSIMNEDNAQAFKAVYRNVEDIDLFPAGLAEYPLEGGLVGSTFACIIGQQFQNTKLGDRFWYESADQPKPFSLAQLNALREVSFSKILCECSSIKQLQPKAFLSQHLEGNSLKPCKSYEPLDLSAWKE